jgi:hypothetical protein
MKKEGGRPAFQTNNNNRALGGRGELARHGGGNIRERASEMALETNARRRPA